MINIKNHIKTRLLGLTFTLLVMTLINPETPLLKNMVSRIEGIIYDVRLRATLPSEMRASEHNIFIVDIDEHSLKTLGRWPWSRKTLATLVSRLAEAGVVVTGFDVIFSEAEINPVDKIVKFASKASGDQEMLNKLGPALQSLYKGLDGDSYFADVLQQQDIVLGVLFNQDENINVGYLNDSKVVVADKLATKFESLYFPGIVANLARLQKNAAGQGFINSVPDQDGYIRRAALVIQHKGEFYPSLALESARLYNLAEQITLETLPLPHTQHHSINALTLGLDKIPTDEYGRVLVPFRGGERAFPYYSAADIINRKIAPALLENGIALVGTSAGGLADLRTTSVGLQYPGVEVHANVLEGILQPELFSFRPNWWQGALFVQVLVLGLILSLVLPSCGPFAVALLSGGALVFVVGVNLLMWHNKVELPVLPPLLLVFLLGIYNLGHGFFREDAKKQLIKSMFDQYVPPAHIDKMLNDPGAISLEGERKELSVLFSDIRSFTSISEKLSPNDLKSLLNEYFSPITKLIFDHSGTIDKYVGDMVMAFWGAPLNDAKHAENAVISGFEILATSEKLKLAFVAKGWPAISVGIGINTGEMNVGDMGSQYRRAYTVLGDAVNLGARLEGLTKFYELDFLVSEFTQRQCPNIVFRPIDKVQVKGKSEAVAIFEPVCLKRDLSQSMKNELDYLDQAYQAYLAQRWQQAEQGFRNLQKIKPERKLYGLYLARISQLRTQQLPEHWNGAYIHTSK